MGHRDRSGRRPNGERSRADAAGGGTTPVVMRSSDNGVVPLFRIAWLVTVLACVLTCVVLLLSGYQGYAAVFLAVGLSAAINLTTRY
jgi:hypothetical protein